MNFTSGDDSLFRVGVCGDNAFDLEALDRFKGAGNLIGGV